MKKLFLFFAIALLVGCVDYTDDFNAIDERLDALELKDIPSIEEQIDDINAQLVSLKATDDAIKAQISELEKSDQVAVASDIADLKEKNSALEKSINDLQNYVDTQIANAKSEAAAAYATVEQYNAIVAQLNALQSSTTKLGEDLTAKINTEVASLNGRIADLEARLKAVEDKVESLLARIQSVSYIPTYSDGKATLEYTDSESKVTLDFEISPKDAVAELAKVWDSAISVKAVYTQTRAVSFVDMPIINFEADAEKGVISVTASGENLSEEFFAGTQEASIALTISDGNNSVISEYIPMVLNDLTPKVLTIVADKTTIYNDGIDSATFTVYYNDTILGNGYNILVNRDFLEGNKFCSTVEGTFEIRAAYGTVISNTVNINVVATPPPAPTAPQDTNPSKTNFIRRILLTQFLGTANGFDPELINVLHTIAANPYYGDKFVLAAAHLYNATDPAYLNNANMLNTAVGVYNFPTINADMWKNEVNRNTYSIGDLIDDALDRTNVKGGIAVNSAYHAEEEYIVLNATVKAKVTEEFRIGAWLLEDGIIGQQENNGYTAIEGVDFNTHNNCIRLADSKASDTDFSGYSLGIIEAGKTASRAFAFKLKPNGNGSQTMWNHNNLRVVVFISTKENGKWYVNNVVSCPKHGSVDFEYAD